MIHLKYICLILFTIGFYSTAIGQCTVPSSKTNKFVVLETGKQLTAESTGAKYLSGGVVLQINDYTLKADSAVVNHATGLLEAYGNVVLEKYNTVFINGTSVVYREDAHLLNFTKAPGNFRKEDEATASTTVLYDVTQ